VSLRSFSAKRKLQHAFSTGFLHKKDEVTQVKSIVKLTNQIIMGNCEGAGQVSGGVFLRKNAPLSKIIKTGERRIARTSL